MITDAKGKRWRGLTGKRWDFAVQSMERPDLNPAELAMTVGFGAATGYKLAQHPQVIAMIAAARRAAIAKGGDALVRYLAKLDHNRAVALGEAEPGPHAGALKEVDVKAANEAAVQWGKAQGLVVERAENKTLSINLDAGLLEKKLARILEAHTVEADGQPH